MRAFGPFVVTGLMMVLPAQEAGKPPAEPPRAVRVDQVIATVNDTAIMLSTIQSQSTGELNTLSFRLGRPLKRAEIMAVYARSLGKEIQRHAMAQSAKSFGVYTPEIVERIVEEEIERQVADQVRDLGSEQAFSRERARDRRTWETYRREKRVEELAKLAEVFAVHMRMKKQRNLFLTPRMLRETYRRNIDQFVQGAMAGVALVTISGPDAEQQAKEVARLWAEQDLSAAELATALPTARITPVPLPRAITEESRESLASELVDFALAGPGGAVSTPRRTEVGYQVAKVLAFRPASNGRFEDRNVQLALQAICMKSVIAEFEKQAMARAADRTEVWIHPEFR